MNIRKTSRKRSQGTNRDAIRTIRLLFQLSSLKSEHKDKLSRAALDLEDESTRGSAMDNQLASLRAEVCSTPAIPC